MSEGIRHLWVIIPAYNEAGTIQDVIASIPSVISHKKQRFVIHTIVVDDHSTDNTAALASSAGAIVLRHIINSGVGAGTRTGLRYVMEHMNSQDYAITIDADGQHNAGDISVMLKHALHTGASVVIGNRIHKGNSTHMPIHRIIGNVMAAIIGRSLFGIRTLDTQSGLRLFDAAAVPVISKYTIDRYGFSTELLWLATRANLYISEAPISVTYSKETLAKGQNNWGAIDVLHDLLWIRISR